MIETDFRPRCTVCGEHIPADHPKPATALTCSDICRDIRMEWRRKKENKARCKYCFKPASPAERSRYRRWRNFEKKNPPPDSELSPEEIEEREHLKINPPRKRGRPALPKEEHERPV